MSSSDTLDGQGSTLTTASTSADLLGLTQVVFDRDYAIQRFLNPLERGDVHRDLGRTFCQPRPVVCRCGTSIASIKARYRARVKARSRARMRILLRKLQKQLKGRVAPVL